MIGLSVTVALFTSFCIMFIPLVLGDIAAILGNGCEFQAKKICCMASNGGEMDDGAGLLELHVPFYGVLQLGGSHAEKKEVTIKRSSSVEALTPFNEENRGIIKLQAPFRGKGWGYL